MTARFIQSEELLDLADFLAGRGAGQGRPRTIYLRRAISSAYYAMFHKLCQHIAEDLIGETSWSPKHAAAARWIAHTDLTALAEAANGRGNLALRNILDPVDARVAGLFKDFLDLQGARHSADYDDFFDVTKSMTLSYIDSARSAVNSADQLYDSGEPSYGRFLGLGIGAVKIAKTR